MVVFRSLGVTTMGGWLNFEGLVTLYPSKTFKKKVRRERKKREKVPGRRSRFLVEDGHLFKTRVFSFSSDFLRDLRLAPRLTKP